MTEGEEKKPDSPKPMRVLPILFEIGWQISVPLVIFVLVGNWIDKKYHTTPTFLLTGIFLSLFTSSMAIYRQIKDMGKK